MKTVQVLAICASLAIGDAIPRVCSDVGPKARFATKVFRMRSVTLNGVPLDSASRQKIWMLRPGKPDGIKPFIVLDGAVMGQEALNSTGTLQSFVLVEPVSSNEIWFTRKTAP